MKTRQKIMALLLSILLVFSIVLGVQYIRYKDGLPILGYHNVVPDEIKETYYAHNIYVMSESKFEEQMKYLADHHYQTLTMDELYDYYYHDKKIAKNSVVLTFDDGFESFNTIVKPILEKYQLQATCFVIGKKTTLIKNENPSKYTYLQQDDLQNDQNVQYYSHTYNLHHKAGLFKKQMEVASYKTIKQDFEKNEGIVSDTYFAFPYGRTSDYAQQVLAKRHVKLAFGYGQNRKMIKRDDPYLLPRYIMYDFLPMFAFRWFVN